MWIHRHRTLTRLGDYAESSPKLAAVAAFDQTEGLGASGATFVVLSATGHLSAWVIRSDRGAA